MEKSDYRVLRRLDSGTRIYEPGDVRQMADIDAKALVASGAIERVKKTKVEAPPKNKTAES